MCASRVISVIPFEMASEYVKRMMAQGTESERFYHDAYHAYWDWGSKLAADGFTEHVYKEALRLGEMVSTEDEGDVASTDDEGDVASTDDDGEFGWWAQARGYWLFCATNGQKCLSERNVLLETRWDGMSQEERKPFLVEAAERGSQLSARLTELCGDSLEGKVVVLDFNKGKGSRP